MRAVAKLSIDGRRMVIAAMQTSLAAGAVIAKCPGLPDTPPATEDSNDQTHGLKPGHSGNPKEVKRQIHLPGVEIASPLPATRCTAA
jgi:hypothetical protein